MIQKGFFEQNIKAFIYWKLSKSLLGVLFYIFNYFYQKHILIANKRFIDIDAKLILLYFNNVIRMELYIKS